MFRTRLTRQRELAYAKDRHEIFNAWQTAFVIQLYCVQGASPFQ